MQRFVILLVSTLTLASCTTVNVTPEGKTSTSAQQAAQQSGETSSQKKGEDDSFKPWEKVTKDTREIEGYFTFHKNEDDGSLLWEVAPEQIGTDFGMMMHYSRGVGDFNVHDGLYLSRTRLMRFRRVGNTLHLVHRNARFTADDGSAIQAAMEENLGHSIVGSFKIKSKNDETDALLVDVTDFFVSDYARVSDRLKYRFQNKPVGLRKKRSYVAEVMGFPKNVEVDALLSYRPSGDPSSFPAGISDARSIPVGVRYSIFQLPEDPATPRPADDRVGYFTTSKFDFSKDRQPESFESYVNRWRLEKEHPEAALSEPVEPIVYYLDRSIPKEYRGDVRAGIEAWRKAFRAAGFKNAIEARLAPDDSTWSAEDVRYSTIRWTPGYNMGYAIGPSQADPRTGELLNADILISSRWPSFWMRDWDFLADDVAKMIERDKQRQRLRERLPAGLENRLCTAAAGRTQQMALQYTALAARGAVDPAEPMPEKYLSQAIRDLVMHEVGHTLGLRHNFKASSAIPADRLHDEAFTRKHGVALSVMDYAPVNVAPPGSGEEQGYYWNPEVGSYDVWAIRYGYAPAGEQPGTESAPTSLLARENALDAIAEQSTDPMHTYATDGDRFAGVDPLTTADDLGSAPLEWAETREQLVSAIQPALSERLIGEGMPWHRVRQALPSLLYERYGSLQPAVKMVGGIKVVRNHRGDPGAQPPLTPVPADRQRAAVRTITEKALAPGAFSFDAELLNRLAPDFSPNWGNGGGQIDFPIHDQVAALQGALVRDLLHPERLGRIIDNAARMPENPYRAGELFSTLTDAVWSELETGASVNSFRRNLQRAHLERLEALLLHDEVSGTPVPADARSLARYELSRLSDRLEEASSQRQDQATRAHLAEAQARIDQVLSASLTEHVEE